VNLLLMRAVGGFRFEKIKRRKRRSDLAPSKGEGYFESPRCALRKILGERQKRD